ncbi:MAG TPA: glycoside hydrolase family 16 protein [Polyangia bacterium]|nr:glycoside hydrolase family 16 protein [Polyangia bacterium]
MIAAALAVAALASGAVTGPAPAGAPVGFAPGCGYRVVKDWDFASAIRDEQALRREFFTRYVYADGSLDHLNDEWSRYRDRDNHVFTSDGLALVARLPSGSAAAPGAVESGMLRSRWNGEYGVFEIRMKVPAGRGLWPAFWLNPEDGGWPPEIDVVEIVNNGRDTSRQSFHFLHPDGGTGPTKLDARHAFTPGGDYADAFHVFAVEWTRDRVRHFVDGSLVADRPFRWQHKDGSDGGPAHVLVNLAVGGKWPGPPQDDTIFPARLHIAYIRVWQR